MATCIPRKKLLLFAAVPALAGVGYIPIDSTGSSYMGRENLENAHSVPIGYKAFVVVPSLLGSANAGEYACNAHYAFGPNSRTLDIPVNLYGVTAVCTLLDNFCGSADPNLAAIRFIGSNDGDWTFWLRGNTDMRDYNHWIYTNTIEPPRLRSSTISSASGGIGSFPLTPTMKPS